MTIDEFDRELTDALNAPSTHYLAFDTHSQELEMTFIDNPIDDLASIK